MTEDEAKKKWCCGPKLLEQSLAAQFDAKMGRRGLANNNCIASSCMAWRATPLPMGAGDSDDGYCGLAGKPQ